MLDFLQRLLLIPEFWDFMKVLVCAVVTLTKSPN